MYILQKVKPVSGDTLAISILGTDECISLKAQNDETVAFLSSLRKGIKMAMESRPVIGTGE